MGGRRPPPTTSLDGWDEPADVYVVITVCLEKTFRFPSALIFGVNTSVSSRLGVGTGTGAVLCRPENATSGEETPQALWHQICPPDVSGVIRILFAFNNKCLTEWNCKWARRLVELNRRNDLNLVVSKRNEGQEVGNLRRSQLNRTSIDTGDPWFNTRVGWRSVILK